MNTHPADASRCSSCGKPLSPVWERCLHCKAPFSPEVTEARAAAGMRVPGSVRAKGSLLDSRVDRQPTASYLAWNVVIPAAIGAVPIVGPLLIDPPPYATFDPVGMLVFVLLPVCGVVAGLFGRHRATVYLDVAVSFWIAQSFALWFSVCTSQYDGATCGPGGGVLLGLVGLAFAAFLAGVLGVLPLTVVFRFARRGRRA